MVLPFQIKQLGVWRFPWNIFCSAPWERTTVRNPDSSNRSDVTQAKISSHRAVCMQTDWLLLFKSRGCSSISVNAAKIQNLSMKMICTSGAAPGTAEGPGYTPWWLRESCVCTLRGMLKALNSKCFRDTRKGSKTIYLFLPSTAAQVQHWNMGPAVCKTNFLVLSSSVPSHFSRRCQKFLLFFPLFPRLLFVFSEHLPIFSLSGIFPDSLCKSSQKDFQYQIFFPFAVKVKNKNFLISRLLLLYIVIHLTFEIYILYNHYLLLCAKFICYLNKCHIWDLVKLLASVK